MGGVFFFVLALISINLVGMETREIKPKCEYIFEHFNNAGNVKFFKPSQTTFKKFEGGPSQALLNYSVALAQEQKPTLEQEKALLVHQDAIVNFMRTICPQIELEGKIPAINPGYNKVSPNTYLYNEKSQDHLSVGFLSTAACSVKADLLSTCEGYYDLQIERHAENKQEEKKQDIIRITKKINLSTPACCIAIDPRNCMVYVGFSNGGIGVFDAGDKNMLEHQPYQKLLKYHKNPIQTIRFFYDNYLFVSKTAYEVVIWHTDTQKPLLRLDVIKCGHEHLFSGTIVRSHAHGWYQDLEYVIPDSWTNFDTYTTTEQLAYIYLLFALYHNGGKLSSETQEAFVRYLLRNCFTVGFDDTIAQAFLKNLQRYIQSNKNFSALPIPVRLLLLPAQNCYDALVYKDNLPIEAYEKFCLDLEREILSFLEKPNFLDSLPQNLLNVCAQNQKTAARYTRIIMPSLFIVEQHHGSLEFMNAHVKNDENKLKLNCLALDYERLALPTTYVPSPVKTEKSDSSGQTALEEKAATIKEIVITFKPTDEQLSAGVVASCGDKIDLCYTTEIANAQKFIVLPHQGRCIAFSSKTGMAAVGLDNGAITLIDCSKQQITRTTECAHSLPIIGIQFTPNGKYYISYSSDGIYVWQTGAVEPSLKLKHDDYNYEWHVFDDCIIGVNNGFFSCNKIVYDLSERILDSKKIISIKEMCFFYSLRDLSTKKTITCDKAILLNSLYNWIPTTFGPGIYTALRSFILHKAMQLNVTLTDKKYNALLPRIGSV